MYRGSLLVALGVALVLGVAACGGDEAVDGEAADGEAAEIVEFVAGDQYFEDLPDTVSAGTVEFVMDNEGVTEHDLTFDELDDREVVPLTSGGETGRGTVDFEPGTYTLYCSVPGHRAQMEHTLQVE